MLQDVEVGEEPTTIHAHLEITQLTIGRMASNSASCKAWCITLVAAILVIVADKGKPDYTLIALIPAILFMILDTYYLALERCFRQSYNSFVEKLHSHSVATCDLYAVTPLGLGFKACAKAMLSFSIWPFYLTLGVMIWLTKTLLIP